MFEELMGRIVRRFAQEPRRRVRQFVAGLPRTNCWTIAKHVGEATPYGLQHLLGRAVDGERPSHVWLTYAAPARHGLIDRASYLPRCWTDDPDRRARAGAPAGIGPVVAGRRRRPTLPTRTVRIQRYQYRGAKIGNPWTAEPRTA